MPVAIKRDFALGSWTCTCGAITRTNLRSRYCVSWLAICVGCQEVCEIMPLPLEDDPDAA